MSDLDQAIQKASQELPEGFEIFIDIRRGSVCVDVYCPLMGSSNFPVDGEEKTTAEKVEEALQRSIKLNKKEGQV